MMNDTLIQKLMEQATEWMTDTGKHNYKVPNFSKYTFADLLVKECVTKLQDCIDRRIPASEYPEIIRKHFYDKQ